MSNWECLKCGHKWTHESEVEPRFCPLCGAQMFVLSGYLEKSIEKGMKRYKIKA